MPNTEKSAMVVIPSNCVDSSVSKIKLQLAELFLSIFAEALYSDGQRKLLPTTCLIVSKHRRGRFEKGIATWTEQRWIVALITKRVFAREPTCIEWAQSAGKNFRRQVEKACTGTTAKIFITAADSEINAHGSDIHRKDADSMIGINQQFCANAVARIGELFQIMYGLSVHEHNLRNHDEIDLLS